MLQIDWGSELPPTKPESLLVVAVTKDDIEVLDQRFGAGVMAAATSASFEGNPGDSFRFSVSAPEFQQVLLLGGAELDEVAAVRRLAFEAGRAARSTGVVNLVLDVRGRLGADDERTARQIAEGLELAGYSYERYLGEDRRKPARLETVTVVAPGDTARRRAGTERGQIIAQAISRARDLGNGPAELVTPTYLAETAGELAAELRAAGHDVTCEVFDVEECERRSMGLYLAVARGSSEPAKFIHLTYKPKAPSKGRICLVGKGVTFDSGGYSIKPSDGMLQMKLDMGGAAAVIGAMHGIARLELPYEVHVISAAAENMVSGNAYRLGDVFRASNGKTVEINNTDAEGRLTLADALVFAASLEPDLVIDFATLTGACVVALGPHICGVMTRDDALASEWVAAGEQSGEDMWRLPLPKPLMSMLDSKIADLRNTGERWGGALTAGLFLEQFNEGKRWMHVDIAGPAIVEKGFGVNIEGSSGVPVATILEFLSRGAAL
ncbi:leucyl aminopeptidase family protein [Enhygromyxa salina]|uniref:Probable cytosol aminopeptidase n=1 Tax=Enhygromyxa salina TaxID=215803 RepID=A0A2S9YLH3_9BACT|nr:leucyl aminopeptidase [Enhygromyxa salina]PRQ05955.1 Cytosol aminopeptidase [Enhygromyxa salina]